MNESQVHRYVPWLHGCLCMWTGDSRWGHSQWLRSPLHSTSTERKGRRRKRTTEQWVKKVTLSDVHGPRLVWIYHYTKHIPSQCTSTTILYSPSQCTSTTILYIPAQCTSTTLLCSPSQCTSTTILNISHLNVHLPLYYIPLSVHTTLLYSPSRCTSTTILNIFHLNVHLPLYYIFHLSVHLPLYYIFHLNVHLPLY